MGTTNEQTRLISAFVIPSAKYDSFIIVGSCKVSSLLAVSFDITRSETPSNEDHIILVKAISQIHQNRTEKLKCNNAFECFHIYAETKRNRTLNRKRARIGFYLFGFAGRISAKRTGNFNKICTNTATWVVYILVIMKSLMDSLARQLCHYLTSTILQTADFYGARPRATIKTTN